MPWIALSATDSNNAYSGKAKVLRKYYNFSKLFYKYEHRSNTQAELGDITVYKQRNWSWSGGNQLTISVGRGSYSNVRLSYEEVYFNVYENKTPLILVLHFSGAKSKYYRLSNIDNEIKINLTKNVEDLIEYENEENLLTDLLKENDKIKEYFTYEIDKKDINTGQNGTVYNEDKINVKKMKTEPPEEQYFRNILSQITQESYSIHKHEPKTRNKSHNSCFLYNKNVPMGKNKVPVENIQNKKLNVRVYWNDKVNEPLLLEFNQGGAMNKTQNKYYYHQRDTDGFLYWEELKMGDKVLGVSFLDYQDLYQQIEESYQKLITILKTLKPNFQKYLYIMLDKKNLYTNLNITSSFKESKAHWLVKDNITPIDKTTTFGKCLKGTNFKIYEHDFTSSVNSFKTGVELRLKFIIPKSTDNGYNELKLNDNSSEDHITYTKGIGESKLYVYFYGEDPRPLLLCLNGTAFRPKDRQKYDNEWATDSNVTKCVCQANTSPPQKDSTDEKLLRGLLEVIGFLNEVKLEQRPPSMSEVNPNKSGLETEKYDIHTFRNQKIYIQMSYENKSCYRIYKHKPIGTRFDGSGYRLGDIKYNATSSVSSSSYDSIKPLNEVSVFHYVFDKDHKYPLLVGLKFSGGENYYYQLKQRDEPFSWDKINDVNPGNIESKIDNIRTGLNLQINKSNQLFKPGKCNDDGNNSNNTNNEATIAGASVGAVGGVTTIVGGGFAVYKYPEQILSFLKKII